MKTTAATFAFLFLVACSGSSGQPTSPEDFGTAAQPDATPLSGKDAGTPTTDASGGGTDGAICQLPAVTNPEFLCDPAGAGSCQSCTDCPAVEDGTAKMAAATCGTQCLGSTSPTCAKDCIKKMTPLSDGCASCLNTFYQCLVMNCLSECTAGGATACTMCSRSKPQPVTCSAGFAMCSGITVNPNYKP